MPINIDGSKGIRQNTTEVTKIPVGTTAQRPANPEAGMIRFNTDEGQVEGYDGISWGSIGLEELLAAVTEAADIDEAVSFVGRGAIVESGTNANGSYVRWENGEQVAIRKEVFGGSSFQLSPGQASEIGDLEYPASFTTGVSAIATGGSSGAGRDQQVTIDVYCVGSNANWRRVACRHNGQDSLDRPTGGVPLNVNLFAWGFWK